MIRFLLTGDSSSLQKAAKDARAELNSLKGTTDVTTKGVVAFGAAAAAAAAVGLAAVVTKTAAAIEAQADLARQLDTTSASMAVLERAGDLAGVSMETITAASNKLKLNLSDAAASGGPASDALARLGLKADELAALPLDQRILAINAAIKETIPPLEQASVAGDLFGKKTGAAILALDTDVMAEAARQAEVFGTALSEVDAAKVGQATDAFGVFGMALDGIAKQFTVQVAPVLTAVSKLFLDSAEEAGGFGNVAETVFDKLVDGAAFAMNAFDGLKRLGSLVLDSIILFVSEGGVAIDKFALGVVETLDKIPGVDLSDSVAAIRADLAEVEAFADTASRRIDESLNKPLAGDKFKQFVEEAKAASQAAAEAEVAARGPGLSPTGGATTAQADEAAKAAAEAQKAKDDAAAKALEAEKAQLASRIEAIRQANMTEAEMADAKFIAENEALKKALELKQITQDEAAALSAGAAQRYSDEKLAIDQRRADQELRIEQQKEAAKRQILSGALSGLTSLMNSGSRKLFEIGKVAAISQAIVSTITGATKALELGFPLGPIAASAISLAGFANVDAIRSQQFGGGSANKGGTAAPSVTQSVNAQTTPVASPNESRIFVEGVDPSALYTGSAMRNLAEKLVEFSRGGGNTSVQFA